MGGVYAEVSSVLDWVNSYVSLCESTDPAPTNEPPTGCALPAWKGDDYCDDENNTAACDWDGGDCCNNTNEGWDNFCTACQCLDPDNRTVILARTFGRPRNAREGKTKASVAK